MICSGLRVTHDVLSLPVKAPLWFQRKPALANLLLIFDIGADKTKKPEFRCLNLPCTL